MRTFRNNHGPEELFHIRLDPIIKRMKKYTSASMSYEALEGWDYSLHRSVTKEIDARMKTMNPGESFRMHLPTFRVIN